MELENIKTIVTNKINKDAVIIYISQTGSRQLTNLDSGDIDLRFICENLDKPIYRIYIKSGEIDDNSYDIFVYDVNYYSKMMSLDLDAYQNTFGYLQIYDSVLYGSLDNNYDIFSIKDKYIDSIKTRLSSRSDLFSLYYTGVLSDYKKFVHAYIVLKIFENNSTDITNEMIVGINNLYNKDGIVELQWIFDKLGIEYSVT